MSDTRFWLIRHAIVEENARAVLYGIMDVELCPHSLIAQAPMYEALARRLPRPATWCVTPLSRTRRTAEAIFRAGYPTVEFHIEPGMIEQNLGAWQGLPHAEVPARLTEPAHAFWPLSGTETPPGGESFSTVIARVGAALERWPTAIPDRTVVSVSHGGRSARRWRTRWASPPTTRCIFRCRISRLIRIDRIDGKWRVVCVNEVPGY